MALEQIVGRRVLLADVAHARLRDAVVDLSLAPGEAVTEERLARELAVSRPVVREAVQRLQAEGLVERQGNGRLRVVPVSRAEAHQLYAVRAALETVVVDDAMDRMTTAGLDLLRASLRRMQADAVRQDGADVVLSGTDFHETLLDLSQNAVAATALAQLKGRIDRYRRISVASDADRPARSAHEHAHILAAVERGDRDAARVATTAHIRAAELLTTGSLPAELGAAS
jgi:DNA-binding GntR family transcriptional regulator